MKFAAWFVSMCIGSAAMSSAVSGKMPWDMNALSQVPEIYAAPGWERNGIKPLFYKGVPYKGKPTRVFAYLGIPQGVKDQKVPGMVLVHGGTGTAFEQWVKMWNDRGYAAIAMDTEGTMPSGKMWESAGHDWGGPGILTNCFDPNVPVQDHWSYHAVSAVILGHSLLRSWPQVDPNRIGITGISWGGYKTCMAASIDKRFRCAIPVYGCGFLDRGSLWQQQIAAFGKDKWLKNWDPSAYLGDLDIPILWITGTNDPAYYLCSFQESYLLPRGPRAICIRSEMKHSHPDGWEPNEIYAFADSVLKNGIPLTRIVKQGSDSKQAWVEFAGPSPVIKTELIFTKDNCAWPDRKWCKLTAVIDSENIRAAAELPDNASIYYFNLTDARKLVVSTEHVQLTK